MDPSFFKNAEDAQLHNLAEGYFDKGDHIKALEVIEDAFSKRGKENLPGIIHFLQGYIFFHLSDRTENSNMKFAFLLSCVESFTENGGMQAFYAVPLFQMAKQLDSALYYRKALKSAKQSLCFLAPYKLSLIELQTKCALENIIKASESKILRGPTAKNSEPTHGESKEVRNTIRSDTNNAAGKRLRSYWSSMNVEGKRNFLKVNTAKLRSYVKRLYGKEGQGALDQVLDFARVNKKWKFWMCRTCSQKFYYAKKFKNHLEQEHAAKFKPSTTKHMAQRVDEVWARMISVGGWEPVDAVAAAEMFKTRLEFVKGFVYENGWSKDWPLAADEERRKLLKEIKLLLVSLWESKVLSCSIRDWMMHFPIKHLAQFEVTKYTLKTECHLLETPQSICFLDSHELNQILGLLKLIKCERNDGTDLICRAVDNLWGLTRVKEKIELDDKFSFMLLDKRLLRGKIASFDDEGTVDVCDQNDYYTKTHPKGDDIITWLLDYPLIDESFEFPKSVRAHNLDIWVAVLRAIHFTCRTLGTKYAKKLVFLRYSGALIDAKNLCMAEDERRRNVPEDQWSVYASLLGQKCEEHLTKYGRDSINAILFLCAVLDILQGASHPTFEFPDLELEDCLNLIHGHKNLSDDIVLKSIDRLKPVVTNKVPLLDSKILLVENSRIRLLNELTRLSVFDYRSYILHLLKSFLREELDGIVNMDAKAKVDVAEADLVSAEKQEKKKKTAGSKKKKHRGIKRTSRSISSVLEQNFEYESSVDHEPGDISLKTAEEDSMEPEDTLSSKRGRLDISFNTDNQEEAAKDMPGEDSLTKYTKSPHGTAATRCNLALDMTLKALCNIKVLKEYLVHNRHQFADNVEELVPCALRNFFTAFVSKEIKQKGLYSYLLGNLLASLEEVHSMSTDAAELLVSILEFWPCSKTSDIESFVTHLFTLEEYEIMSCSKCEKSPNYPEQSSYGVVMAADSIRDLKCAFGNMNLEEILKVIRMEDKMLCDIKTEGCGNADSVHHFISRCPPIFTVVLIWEKNQTEKDIYETTKALDLEIDISRIYEGLEPSTKYRLVSMVGCGEDEEYICLAYKKNQWVSFRHEALAKKAVGSWKTVVRFCEERKVRLEILFYEAVQ